MIDIKVLNTLILAQEDLDDMDFTALWGHDEGLELFAEYYSEFDRDLLGFISSMSEERKRVFIDYINDQFSPE